jgi:hypothetical protein
MLRNLIQHQHHGNNHDHPHSTTVRCALPKRYHGSALPRYPHPTGIHTPTPTSTFQQPRRWTYRRCCSRTNTTQSAQSSHARDRVCLYIAQRRTNTQTQHNPSHVGSSDARCERAAVITTQLQTTRAVMFRDETQQNAVLPMLTQHQHHDHHQEHPQSTTAI